MFTINWKNNTEINPNTDEQRENRVEPEIKIAGKINIQEHLDISTVKHTARHNILVQSTRLSQAKYKSTKITIISQQKTTVNLSFPELIFSALALF